MEAQNRTGRIAVAPGGASSQVQTVPNQVADVSVATSDREVRRVNVNFSTSAYETLEQLAAMKQTSMSEVLRDAIQLEKWLTDAQAEGWHILLERNGQVREIVRI